MDIKEVDLLRDNVLWLRDRMPTAMGNWQASKPNCEYNTGLIKDICYRPGTLISEVFDPMIKWLSDYILEREGRIKTDTDTFLKAGLYRMFRFVTVADYFAKNSQYFVGNNFGKAQKDYRDFINILLEKLIGCNKQMTFMFLQLTKTVKNLPDDLRQMQIYLENQCTSLKIRNLERK
jgi:hypothetical protein